MILAALHLRTHSLKAGLESEALREPQLPQVFGGQAPPQTCNPVSGMMEEDAVLRPLLGLAPQHPL